MSGYLTDDFDLRAGNAADEGSVEEIIERYPVAAARALLVANEHLQATNGALQTALLALVEAVERGDATDDLLPLAHAARRVLE